jgi:hypothetical protein
MHPRTVIALGILLIATACKSASAPSDVVRGDALVTTGAEGCKIGLLIHNQRYEPIGLADSLAVVGTTISVVGTVVDRPSICMIGPGLELISARVR